MAIPERKLRKSWVDYGLSHYDNETPEMRAERKKLEKRIAEESGPVRTFSAVEELVPEQGRRGTKGVSLRKHGLYILTAITQHLDRTQPKMRIMMNWITKQMTIEFDPAGPWKVTYHDAGRGAKNVLGKFGSRRVRDRLADEGIALGTYHAEVKDGGKKVVVDFTKRIG